MGKSVDGRLWCDGCGVQISWAPHIHMGEHALEIAYYCCRDCANGFSCDCGYRMELADEDQREPRSGLIYSG